MRKVPYKEAVCSKGFFSKLFCVPKPGLDKWQTVINMKPLNRYIRKEGFRMEGVKDVKVLIQPRMFGAIIDLSDAYYHV